MKHAVKILSIFMLLALLVMPASPAYAKGVLDDKVVFGATYTLTSGQTQNGDVAIFGGAGVIEEGATVNGALVLFGGSLSVNGTVNGDVIVVGGAATLGGSARISGDVVTIGAALQREEGAVVSGQVITNVGGADFDFEHLPPSVIPPNAPQIPAPEVSGSLLEALDPLGRALDIFFRALALGFLALLVTLFLPRQTDYISNAVARQPVLAGGLGLLTVVIFPLALLLLIITIILIPVALLAVLVLATSIVWGWLALGMEVGQRLIAILKVEWPLPVGAALGTFLLTLVTGTVGVIPCIGWIAPVMVAVLGLGGVLMTSFGTRVVLPPDGFAPVPGPFWERPSAPESPSEPAPAPKPRTPPAGRKMAAGDDEPLPPTS